MQIVPRMHSRNIALSSEAEGRWHKTLLHILLWLSASLLLYAPELRTLQAGNAGDTAHVAGKQTDGR